MPMLLLWTILFLQIPANILALYVALRMQGASVPFKRLAMFGAALGILLSVLRAYAFGFHGPIHAVILLLTIQYLSRGRWAMAVLATLLIHVSAYIGEGLLVVPLVTRLGISLAEALANPVLFIGGGWIGNVPLLLGAVFLWLRSRNQRAAVAHADL